MDDRIRRDNSEKNENQNSIIREDAPKQNNSSIDIDSNSFSDKINPTAQRVKRFEVHIPEKSDLLGNIESKNEVPTRIPAPNRRPAPNGRPPVRRPVSPNAVNTGINGQAQRPKASNSSNAKAKKGSAKSSKELEKQKKNVAKNAQKLEAKKAKRELKLQKKKEKNKNFAYNFLKGVLVTGVCLIFVGTFVTVVSSMAFSFINDILVVDDESKNYSVTVEIPEGADYDTIFDILVDKGLVSQPLLTDFFCKFRHYDYESAYDEETGELLYDADGKVVKVPVEYNSGVYHIDADSGIENILNSMLVYNNVEKDTVRLTFPEGWTIAEVFEKIEKYEVCDAQKLYANLDIVANQYDFISSITDSEARYRKAEGYLFPDTYDFYVGENASSVLEKLFTNFSEKWTTEYDNRLKQLGLTKDQIITIASIIQAEAKDGTQMADISAVIHNRLNNSASYPTLDMDSTSDYVKTLKSYNLLSEVHYTMYLESYNTYSKIGLPPGPICNPGASAIKAALYPSETKYYFFCHDDNGEIYLASTASEHQENVEKVIYGNVGVTNDSNS